MMDTESLRDLSGLSNRGSFIPEQDLLIAVLERAVLDYYSSNPLIRLEAEEWLFGESDSAELFSMEWVSGHLRIAPGALRRRVKQLQLPIDGPSQAHRWIRPKVQKRQSEPESVERLIVASA